MLRLARSVVAGLACLGGLALGVLVGVAGVSVGVAAVGAVGFGTLVLLNLEASMAVWVFISFFEATPAVELAVKGATLLLFLAWLAAMAHRRALLGHILRRHGRLIAAVVALMVWITVSTTWSERPETGVTLVSWHLAGVVFLVTLTLVSEQRHVRWVAVAFVAGALVTTLAGLGGTPFGLGAPYLSSGVLEDRLQGGVADPNFFASLLVAATALAGGLVPTARALVVRVGLVAVIAILAVGVVATQSRGGLVGLLAAAACAVLALRGRRLVIVALLGVLLGLTGLMLSTVPEAYERVTTVDEGGTGRADIWKVALAIARDHPVIGVGIGNFPIHSRRYVDQVGPLERVDLIAEDYLVAHSFYLELLTETGIVGLGLFAAVVGTGLGACWRAARRLDELGARSLAALAYSVLVGSVAILAGGVFVSGGQDERLWALLALGPAMLAIAERQRVRITPIAGSPPDEVIPPRDPAAALARS